MKMRYVSLALILPLFLYLGYRMVSSFTGWDPLVILSFLALLSFNAVQLLPWKGRWVSLGGLWTVIMIAIVAGMSLALEGGPGLDVAAGMLLASPFLIESWIWQSENSPARRLIALQFAFLDGVMIVAALNTLSASNLPETSSSLLYTCGAVNFEQLRGLYNVLVGLPVGNLPLRNAMDPLFILLGGVALLGVFAPLLEPQTGSGIALPLGEADLSAATVAYSPELELAREETRALFLYRSPSRPPPQGHLPGLGALLASGSVTFLFVLASLEWPSQALLPAFGVLAAMLIAVLVMTRLSISPGSRAAAAPHTMAPGVPVPAPPPIEAPRLG